MITVRARLAAVALAAAAGAAPVLAADSDEVGRRVAASAAAAEAFAGRVDGGWLLVDASGRTLYAIELTSPPGDGRLEGAWRSAGGVLGVVDGIVAERGRLDFRLGGLAVRLSQHGAVWRGVLGRRGRTFERVILRR